MLASISEILEEVFLYQSEKAYLSASKLSNDPEPKIEFANIIASSGQIFNVYCDGSIVVTNNQRYILAIYAPGMKPLR